MKLMVTENRVPRAFAAWQIAVAGALLLMLVAAGPPEAAAIGSGTGVATGNSTAAQGAGQAARQSGLIKRIDVNLSTQTLIAYQGNTRVFTTRISSGVAKHPTPTGTFAIYAKLRSQEMKGGVGREHYDLPGVPYVMYFYGGNAIHGTYWHHNFGHPMSHGCVNATIAAAAWLYNWAPYGTRVTVHY